MVYFISVVSLNPFDYFDKL